jgi:hypothetical protein
MLHQNQEAQQVLQSELLSVLPLQLVSLSELPSVLPLLHRLLLFRLSPCKLRLLRLHPRNC